jgi:hypothetical protein
VAKKKNKQKKQGIAKKKNAPIPDIQIENRLNNMGIKWIKLHKGQYLCQRLDGENITFFATGIIESIYFKEHGLEDLVKICRMEKEPTLDELAINFQTKQSLRLASYMTKEALTAKHKITDFCYANGINYKAHDVIIKAVRKGDSLPYKTFDKLFIFNAATGYTKDEMGRTILPKGADTFISVLKGETSQYAYAKNDQPNIRADFRESPEYIETLKRVRARDGYRCRLCGRKITTLPSDQEQERLEVHHLYSYTDYVSLRMDMNNMISLCPQCHILFNNLNSDNINKIFAIAQEQNKEQDNGSNI